MAASLSLAACQAPIIYRCQQNSDCVEADGGAGVCEAAVGYCSFPDTTCPSGQRFSEHAGDGLSGDCTESPGGSDSTTSTSAATWPEPTTTNGPPPLTDGGDAGSGSSGPGPEPTGSATDACALEQLQVVASIAECTDPLNNDPEQCEDYAGAGHIMVDTAAMDLGDVPFTSFLAFELDEPVTGVQSAWLELTVDPDSGSDSTGELWQVSEFSIQDLSQAQPTKIGNAPVAPDQGGVGGGDTPRFMLPSSMVENATNLHLGLFPLSNDGIQYENLRSTPPRHPRLVVEHCQG